MKGPEYNLAESRNETQKLRSHDDTSSTFDSSNIFQSNVDPMETVILLTTIIELKPLEKDKFDKIRVCDHHFENQKTEDLSKTN